MVEDEEDTTSLLILLLGAYGCKIEHATDGRQAQHMIDTIAPPNLILLDIMLPHLSGLELLPYIRQKAVWHNVPVIMLTADSDEHTVKQALAAGANDYLVKPFHSHTLTARINRFLKPPASHGSL
ncbi:MAG: response regulator [Nitrospira sp.]|nr:MAG: response regulator [Nitrospira sp.]